MSTRNEHIRQFHSPSDSWSFVYAWEASMRLKSKKDIWLLFPGPSLGPRDTFLLFSDCKTSLGPAVLCQQREEPVKVYHFFRIISLGVSAERELVGLKMTHLRTLWPFWVQGICSLLCHVSRWDNAVAHSESFSAMPGGPHASLPLCDAGHRGTPGLWDFPLCSKWKETLFPQQSDILGTFDGSAEGVVEAILRSPPASSDTWFSHFQHFLFSLSLINFI